MIGDIFFDGWSCIQNKLYPVTYPPIPSPKRKYNEYEIPGRDGKLYEDLGTYEDITWDIKFNFKSIDLSIESMFREFRNILRKAKTVCKEIDMDFFYKIKKVDISDIDLGSSKDIANFTVSFTLDPYQYAVNGEIYIQHSSINFNPYSLCHPIYKVIGEGICSITVNGNQGMSLNCTGTVYIDTDRRVAYREDGNKVNQNTSGYFDDLHLPKGEISISVTSGFSCELMPCWRCD